MQTAIARFRIRLKEKVAVAAQIYFKRVRVRVRVSACVRACVRVCVCCAVVIVRACGCVARVDTQ
eukprot:8698410-Alexandrium_andersonii.AAC.1